MSFDVCQVLSGQLSELFSCSETANGHVRVRTPFLYPDGGVVDVFVVQRDDRIDVTDFGEALGWLRLQTVAGRRSPKQNKLLQDVCLTQAVDLFKGQLVSRCGTQDELAQCIVRVAQAVVGLARSSR